MIKIFIGNLGCLSGDTLININRGGASKKVSIYQIWYMFKRNDSFKGWNLDIPTYVRSYDGQKIRLHKLIDAVNTGKKQLYELVLESGHKIECTEDHKIQTDSGMKELRELDINSDFIMIDSPKPKKSCLKTYKINDMYIFAGFHPYKNNKNRIEVHRLIYEAYINNILFKDYLILIWNYPDRIKELNLINPEFFVVHHKDNNHFNNNIDNLEVLSNSEHKNIHADVNKYNFNQGMPEYSRIKSITKTKIKTCYDLCCDDPHHNYVANGIIVSNSGKTVSAVREIILNKEMTVYSNIRIKSKNTVFLKAENIIEKELIKEKKSRDGKVTPVYNYKLNVNFWKNINKDIDVYIDEAHTILNPRRAMHKVNIIVTDWLALLRRVLGSNPNRKGNLTLITQLPRRLDPISRDMASQIKYHICHYILTCQKCKNKYQEHSDMADQLEQCPICGNFNLRKSDNRIEVFCFSNFASYEIYSETKTKTYYRRYMIDDIEYYFKYYNTFQWDEMFSNFY